MSTFLLTLYHIVNDDPQFGARNINFQQFIIISSCAYFIYDTIACIYYGLVDKGLIIHHTMVMIGYSSALFQHYGATEALIGLFFAEVSNFPMHLRMIIR